MALLKFILHSKEGHTHNLKHQGSHSYFVRNLSSKKVKNTSMSNSFPLQLHCGSFGQSTLRPSRSLRQPLSLRTLEREIERVV